MIRAVLTAGNIIGYCKKVYVSILRESGWGTTLSFLLCLMLLTQMLFLFLLSVRAVGHVLTDSAAIQLEVLPTAKEAEIQELYAVLRAHSSVRSVEFFSKQQVYEQQKALHPDDIAFLEQYDFKNPFPDIFSVSLTSLDAYNQFAKDLQDKKWSAIVDPSFLTSAGDHEAEIRTLLQVTDTVHVLSIFATIIALVVLCGAVFEWAKRTADSRGHELLLRHLLGGTSLQVLLPFIAEVIMLLGMATLFASVILVTSVSIFPWVAPALALEAPFQTFQAAFTPLLWTAFPLFVFIQFVCMPFVAYAGTAVAARKSLPSSFVLFP